MYNKLRFIKKCEINFHETQVECRVIYGSFPYGYGRDACCIPQIVVDEKGIAYRPLSVMSDGLWCIVTDSYLKSIGLCRKQIRSVA
jgi:hypothetical protein